MAEEFSVGAQFQRNISFLFSDLLIAEIGSAISFSTAATATAIFPLSIYFDVDLDLRLSVSSNSLFPRSIGSHGSLVEYLVRSGATQSTIRPRFLSAIR